MKTTIRLVTVILTLGIFPVAAAAQEVTPALLLQRIEALESEVRVLKRQLEVKEGETAKSAPGTAVVTASAKDGFSIKSSDEAFKIKLRGYVQADGKLFTDNKEDTGTIDTFLVRRARPTI